ncbi:hypothetical protein PPL_09037 [Heterostelium album PN500]|uniref:VPS9 domain-containing protein n=1 Tax=Heterostelium pallidum (strain ATCC 26659 / Pp 5 / PN500) TaxID=670386 RepID=D3BKF6_HETP5|nr:hypothetical protein PPL_09037 [Heterostelium album PN500]EFA78386.1 hypothetical protein PPL_09037 [Heterostelium album PN500]|eukprot:XP_020430511.1 hypothetical protein PPL_09037 [Heterostelium album PN500]
MEEITLSFVKSRPEIHKSNDKESESIQKSEQNNNEIWINLINTIQDNSFTLKEYKMTGLMFLKDKKRQVLSEIEMTINDIKELEIQSNGMINNGAYYSPCKQNFNSKQSSLKLSQSFCQNVSPTVVSLDMFEMPSCVKVLYSLRMNPNILADCLEHNNRLGRGQTIEHTQLADFITRAIFNGCLTELEERIHLELVETVLLREFNNDPSHFDLANDPCATQEEQQARLRLIVVHIIFSSYIIPELVKPNNLYMITGQIVTQNIKHNLRIFSDRIRTYVESPDSIPKQLNNQHNLKDKLESFCNSIISVHDLKSYFKETYQVKNNSISDIKLMLSNYDLKKIIEIISWDNSMDFKRLSLKSSARMVGEIPMINEKSMVLFWINSTPNPKAKPTLSRHRSSNNIDSNNSSKRELRYSQSDEIEKRNIATIAKGLKTLFLHFDRAQCGFSSDSLRDLILHRQSRLAPTDNTTYNQFEEILKSLAVLPDHIVANNYEKLAMLILKEEEESNNNEKDEYMRQIRSIDQLEQYKKRLLNKKHNMFCSLFFFNTSITNEIDEYIQFIKSFCEGLRYCQCKEIYFQSHCDELDMCDYCLSLKATIQKLFNKISKSMSEIQEQLMNSPTSEQIVPMEMFIYSTYKRKLMINLHSSLFHYSKLNINFQMALNFKINLPNFLENFIQEEIPEKYLDASRWARSINELKKINHLKSPDDMLNCIKETSSTLIRVYSIPHGGYEPDQLISIIAYIILASRVENIVAHVQYIRLYAEIGEDENDLPRFIDAIVYLMNRLCSKSIKSCTNLRKHFMEVDFQQPDSLSDRTIQIEYFFVIPYYNNVAANHPNFYLVRSLILIWLSAYLLFFWVD